MEGKLQSKFLRIILFRESESFRTRCLFFLGYITEILYSFLDIARKMGKVFLFMSSCIAGHLRNIFMALKYVIEVSTGSSV
nr:hypothetical protein Iba_chr12eCG1150 [Ipomoea batatas]